MLTRGSLLALSVLSVLSAQSTDSYGIQSLAGSLTSGDGGPATKALVQGPGAIAIDSAGIVYIGQRLGGAIRRVAVDGSISTIASVATTISPLFSAPPASTGDGGPAMAASIREVGGLALDSANNLYVTDVLGCRIRRINLQTGIITTYAGDGTCRAGADGSAASTSFNIPIALATDAKGGLLVGESNRLRRIDLSNGTVTTLAGTGTAGMTGNGALAIQAQIVTPGGIATDLAGNIYITDATNCLVREIASATGNITVFAGTSCGYAGDSGPAISAKLDTPSGLAIDPANSLMYVTENGTGARIRAIDLSTRVIATYAGAGKPGMGGDGGPAAAAQFAAPSAPVIDKNGALLLAESSNRVRRIDTSGTVTTFAGTPTLAGDGGQASSASIYFAGTAPIAGDHKGGYVFYDSGNGRIRAVSTSGEIRTVAGTDPFSGSTGDGGPALSASLGAVRGITVDAAGNIYFVQAASRTDPQGEMRRITPDGTINKFGSTIYNFALCLGADLVRNVLYVCEGNGNRVDKVDMATGNATVFAGSGTPGAASAEFGFAGDNGPASQSLVSDPTGVAVDGQGNVYIYDQGNARIRKARPSGSNIVSVAGNGAALANGLTFSSGDGGKATSASIFTFTGLAADAAGNFFIGEGNRVRRVDAASGIINTIAGTGSFGFSGDGGPATAAQTSIGGLDIDANGNLLTTDSNRIRLISNPNSVSILTVNTLGGFPDIAQNAWLEIKGVHLAAANLASGLTWSNAPDFGLGKMPTQLGNVSVMVNGKPAFIYYVSPSQVNVLTPLDDTAGPVQIVVTSGSQSSAPVTVNLRKAAPSPFLVGSTRYVLATHADGSLLGPVSLSAAGYAFTPAKPNETIVLYFAGLGLPTTTLVNGASTQSGVLPGPPSIRIGSLQAAVSFAGVISPGLYQLNVIVPVGTTNGDNPISVSYGGSTAPDGILLAVQQ